MPPVKRASLSMSRMSMSSQELQARLRSTVFERQTWELRRAKEAAHLHQYYTQTQQQFMGPAEHRAHVRRAVMHANTRVTRTVHLALRTGPRLVDPRIPCAHVTLLIYLCYRITCSSPQKLYEYAAAIGGLWG